MGQSILDYLDPFSAVNFFKTEFQKIDFNHVRIIITNYNTDPEKNIIFEALSSIIFKNGQTELNFMRVHNTRFLKHV